MLESNNYKVSNNYLETTEFKTIKGLLDKNNLEYMTNYLRVLLNISKQNNPNCFKLNLPKTPGKRTIIYVRLSQEDLDKEKENVSKSILNQLLMLLTYCTNKSLEVVGIFYEEDISGSDETREEWNKTLKFCELGNTDIYICKTQARFARSIEFIEKYLHKRFIEWNIRFLSIVDNIDTQNKSNKKSSQITAMVDEWKIEEQSINTKKTLRAKNNAGQWTGSFAPYGYIEDPKDMYHLIIDEEAAKIVKEIYSMYANGFGYTKICQSLNERKIPTPSRYKKIKGSNYVCPQYPNGADYWNIDTIRKILLDETYDGLLIQHRTEKVAYNVKEYKKIPKNEQCIIACAHERIIDKEISKIVRKKFSDRKKNIDLYNIKKSSKEIIEIINKNLKKYKISQDKLSILNKLIIKLEKSIEESDIKEITLNYNILKEKILLLNNNLYLEIIEQLDTPITTKSRARPDKNGNIHIFSKKVYCSICGKSFQKILCKSGAKKNYITKKYLHCRNNKSTGRTTCNNTTYIEYEMLEKIILKEINKMIDKYIDKEEFKKYYYLNKQNEENNNLTILQKEKDKIEKEICKIKEYFTTIYEDKIKGIISTNEFIILKDKYQKQIDNNNLRINEINKEIISIKNKAEKNKNLQKIKYIEKLNKFAIDKLISKITIGKKDENNNRTIKIFWDLMT